MATSRMLLLFFMLSVMTVQAHADARCKVGTAFANGVWTPEPFANDEALTMSFVLSSMWERVDESRVVVLYHRDAGLKNLSEVLVLKEGETRDVSLPQSKLALFFSVLGLNAQALALFGQNGLVRGMTLEQFVVSYSFSEDVLRRVTEQTVQDSRSIATELANHRPLLVVAHSMGNLYTNAAVVATGNAVNVSNLSVVGLGVPAAYVVDGNQPNNQLLVRAEKGAVSGAEQATYVTNTDDMVINLLRTVSPRYWRPALRGNTTNKEPERPGHAFFDIYWNQNDETGVKSKHYAEEAIERMYKSCSADLASGPASNATGPNPDVQTSDVLASSGPARLSASASAVPPGFWRPLPAYSVWSDVFGVPARPTGLTPRSFAELSAYSAISANAFTISGQTPLLVADSTQLTQEASTQTPSGELPAPLLPYPNALKDGDSPEIPSSVLTAIDVNFHDDIVKRAARAFAKASLEYWISVAQRGWRYDGQRNFVLGESQVCLRTLLRKLDVKLQSTYLQIILTPLTAKKTLFEKFSNADAVASGHPLPLILDYGRACQLAGV